MADEIGGHHRNEATLGHDARLDVVELQPGVGTGHLACGEVHSVCDIGRKKLICTFWQCNPPADGTQDDPGYDLPSTVTLSTDSCRFLPRRTTFTVCHSLSFSFCPANSISGPLPVIEEGEGGGGIQTHKRQKGEHSATHTRPRTPASFFFFYKAGDDVSGENLRTR